MAFTDEEITWFKTMSDDMAKRIEDEVNTSEQGAVVFSGIGRLCTRALAEHASIAAKKEERSTHVSKFQASRQARLERKKQKKGGTATPPNPSSTRAQPQGQTRTA